MTESKPKPSSLFNALIEFKLQDIEIFKQSTNPHFKSKYADLATILDAVEVPLAKLGIAIVSHSSYEGEQWIETTSLKFGSEYLSSQFPLFGTKPQELGSSITYARRFNLQSLLNLAAIDDDANAANNANAIVKVYPTAAAGKKAFTAIMESLNACQNLEDLAETWTKNGEEILKQKAWHDISYDELAKRKEFLKQSFIDMTGLYEANNQ